MKFKVIFLSFLLFLSCTEYTKKDWNKLDNREFILKSVTYIHTDKTKVDAYNFNRDFPIKEVLFLLAHEYKIDINIAEYQNFKLTRDLDQITLGPGLRKEIFTWNNGSSKNTGNEIEIKITEDYFGEKDSSFNITFKHHNNTIKNIEIGYGNTDILFSRLGYYINNFKLLRKEYRTKNYNSGKAPGIIEGRGSKTLAHKNTIDERNRLKESIKKYLQTIPKDKIKSSKKDLIDFIYDY